MCFPAPQKLKKLVTLPTKLPLHLQVAIRHSSSQCRQGNFFSGVLGNTFFLIKRDSWVHLSCHMTGFLSSCIWAWLNEDVIPGATAATLWSWGNYHWHTEDNRPRGWKGLGAFKANYFSISFYNINKPLLVKLLSVGFSITCILKHLSGNSYLI